MKSPALVFALPCLFLVPVHGFAQAAEGPAAEIREWEVPWEQTRPRDPYVAPDGRVWFVGQRGDYLAVFDPTTEQFRRFDLADGVGPHTVVVDDRDRPWYAGNHAAHIGRLDPDSGDITLYPMPDPAARDPHTMTFGRDGSLWFTVQGGNFVGRLSPENGEVELISVPTGGARPYAIVTGADGTLWVALFGTNKLARVDPGTRKLEEIALPRTEARPRRLGLTRDGAVWYTDYAHGYLGRFDPATGEAQEWHTPGGADARPYAIAVDDRDRIWFVETGPEPNRLVGFDPKSGEYFSVEEIASGAGAVRHMVFHAPKRVIWFGTDANTLGRAAIP
ncbi:MAG: virginiamycin B lyase family protein [Thermoanaerobaculia bacterium]